MVNSYFHNFERDRNKLWTTFPRISIVCNEEL